MVTLSRSRKECSWRTEAVEEINRRTTGGTEKKKKVNGEHWIKDHHFLQSSGKIEGKGRGKENSLRQSLEGKRN